MEDWATFAITNASFHPMIEQNLVLYIGDGNYLAQVDASTFTANALDIKTPLVIKSLGKISTDVLLGTYVADTVTKTEIIRWNTWSVSFTTSDEIPENGINAFLPADNYVFVQAGEAGNIYMYNSSGMLELYKKIPGDYSPTKTATVHPNSVANFGGDILFGVSNVTGNPCDELVYRIGRNSRNYPYIMDQPYPISQRSGSDFVLTGVEIGAILVVGSNMYVAWKNSTSYGVDKLDYSNKLDGAYIESRVFAVNREQEINFMKSIVSYSSLPASTDINMYLSINYAAYTSALDKVDDTQRNIIESANESRAFTTMQLKMKVTTSSNSSPEIEGAGVFIS